MNRQQKIDQIAKESGVSAVGNLDVSVREIALDYEWKHCDGVRGATGALQIFKVIRKSGTGPYFIGRWDQKAEKLDIDMSGASHEEVRKFTGSKGGYSGHHTNRTKDPDRRVFDVRITIRGRVIFDGAVSFSNTYDERVEVAVLSTIAVHVSLVHRTAQEKELHNE
jgi:hypothetical protein